MDSEERDLNLIARPLPRRRGARIRVPMENPATDVREDDPLLEPRSDEPGIGDDGDCHPIENPG
jgi:hypothetical protein